MPFGLPGRPVVVAAHVVVVGVLVAVVYTNFLRPEDDSTVSGVAAPGDPEVTQTVEPGRERGTAEGRNGGEAQVRGPRSVATPTGVGATADPLSSSVGPPNGTPESTGSAPTGDQPTDDQYLDAVSRLMVKVY